MTRAASHTFLGRGLPRSTTPNTDKRKSGMRFWLGSATLTVVMFFISLLLVEIILRVFDLAPTSGAATVTEEEFRRVPGIHAPGQHFVDRRKRALPHTVNINELGYRGQSFPLAKEPGEVRVLVVGDSFVYGDFVDDENTLPALLGKQIANQCKSVRVVNAGLGGSTITEHIELARRALQIEPDMMLLVFSENDLSDLVQQPSMWVRLAKNRAAKSHPPFSLIYPVLRDTALWNLVLKVRGNFRNRQVEGSLNKEGSAPAVAQRASRKAPELVPEDLATRYRAELLSLRQLVAAARVPLLLAAYPSHLTLSGARAPDLMDWITETGKAAGLPTTDLSAALLKAGRVQDLYLLPYDGHPSPAGYRTAARAVAESVVTQLHADNRCRS